MGDFFSPLEEDIVSRVEADEDAEARAERARAAAGDHPRVFALWNASARAKIASAGALRPNVLLVAAGPLACRLVERDGAAAIDLDLKPLGAITTSAVSARGLAASPSPTDPTTVVYDVGVAGARVGAGGGHPSSGGGEKEKVKEDVAGGVVLVCARVDVPIDDQREWATRVFADAAPAKVVVLCAVDEHDVDYGADGRREAYALDGTATARGEEKDGGRRTDDGTSTDATRPRPRPRPLPCGALLSGLGAAVAARCELAGTPCRVVAMPAPSGGGVGSGPGFGGGFDGAAAADALRAVGEACGLTLEARAGGPGAVVVGDAMRVFT